MASCKRYVTPFRVKSRQRLKFLGLLSHFGVILPLVRPLMRILFDSFFVNLVWKSGTSQGVILNNEIIYMVIFPRLC